MVATERQESTFPTMVLISQHQLDELQESINELKTILIKEATEVINNEWLESGEARRILGVSQRTWQTYRDKKLIPFSQFGRKIYVKRTDLETFLQSHKVSRAD